MMSHSHYLQAYFVDILRIITLILDDEQLFAGLQFDYVESGRITHPSNCDGWKEMCNYANDLSRLKGKNYRMLAPAVFVDAFKPKNGERAVDCISGFAREALEKAIARDEAGGQPPPAKTYSVSEKHYAWIDSKVTPQPNGVFVQPIKLTGKLEQIAKKIYVRMPKFPHAQFDKALAECTADKTWQIFVNDNSGHDVMIDQPDWLADLLLRVS